MAAQPRGMGIEDQVEFSDKTTIKCYKCYSEQVHAICHHCGRLLCKKCQFNPLGSLHTDNVFARMRPLPNILKQSAHCQDCFHYKDTITRLIVPSTLVIVAILILLLPITQLAWQQTARWTALVSLAPWGARALILLLLARLTWGLYPHLPFPVKYPLGIPIFPRCTIELDEHVKADFNITPNGYLPQHMPCGGQLTAKLGLVPEDEKRYRSAKPRPRDGKVTLHAGFVALDRQKNVKFLKKMKQRLEDGLTCSITKEITPDDFTRLCRERQPLKWTGYYCINPGALRLGPKYDKEFPLFIKPRLLPGGRRLELVLELHQKIARKATLDHLTLDTPRDYKVEDTDGQFDPSEWQVNWRKKKVATDTPLVLYIEFQKPLSTKPWQFQGEYKLTIEDYTLSGLRVGRAPDEKGRSTEVSGYMIASGKQVRAEEMPWMDLTVKHKTTIEGDVSFKTSTFLAYSIHTEPKKPERSENYQVSPNHKIIDAIIKTLTDSKKHEPVYIQQVIETLGCVTGAGNTSNQARCWEIKGRWYIPFTNPMSSARHHNTPISINRPVDIHLVILGEEPQDDGPGSSNGALRFELVLRSVVGKGDQEMLDLQDRYKELRKIIEGAINGGKVTQCGHY